MFSSSIDDKYKTNINPIISIYIVNDIVMIGININSKAYKI
ncbi:hypothetical protein [Spiroplasma turonicum]|nr:hypothetical protein [Spiroplasma turonicum]ALX70520.1 hypothetical protein STURO_v1c02520 [Spiroplasma turonicum]